MQEHTFERNLVRVIVVADAYVRDLPTDNAGTGSLPPKYFWLNSVNQACNMSVFTCIILRVKR